MFGQGSPTNRQKRLLSPPPFWRREVFTPFRLTIFRIAAAALLGIMAAPIVSYSAPPAVRPGKSVPNPPDAAASREVSRNNVPETIRSTNGSERQTAEEAPYPIRLNISWNSAEPSLWNGEIRLSDGFFWNIVPLGTDPAASVTFHPSDNKGTLPFSTPAPTSFCGVQATAVAPVSASLTITLRGENGAEGLSRTFSQDELIQGPVHVPFDVNDHGLVIQRAPGDTIPLTVSRLSGDHEIQKEAFPSMVFDEGETLIVGIFTQFLPPAQGEKRLQLTMKSPDRDEVVWSDSVDLTERLLAERPRLDIPIPIRNLDGAFNVTIELLQTPTNSKGRFPLPQNPFAGSGKDSSKGTLLARRVIQGVAVASKKPASHQGDRTVDLRETLLETIDPTNPSWWKIFARRSSSPDETSRSASKDSMAAEKNSWSSDFLKMWKWGELQSQIKPLAITGNWGRWDSLWQHPLGSGHLAPLASKDPREAAFVRLEPSENPNDPSWESYTVPIKEPGKPHLLEIEYLPDYPQKLGVSVLEPSVSGGIFPRTLDNGLIVGANPLSDQISHRTLRYQVLFWPKTKTPIILLMNRDSERPAVYGRIRIYRAKDRFDSALPADQNSSKRSFTAVMSRPTFCEQFHAENSPAFAGVLGAKDWQTFDRGTRRMADYLKSFGCGSLLLSVMADGSALYPSDLLKPNPKFDSGVFLTEGNDPVRKDVAEYLFRRFEQENLTLIPLLTFNAPLPALEEEIRKRSVEKTEDRERTPASEGLYLIGPKGDRLTVSRGDGDDYAPYNILHPTVRREILRVMDEFAKRYARHESFRGAVLDVSADSFARLPENIYYGLDDVTIRRFVQETELADRCPDEWKEELNDFVNAGDAERYYRRALLIRNRFGNEWIRWRAATVCRFYREAARILTSRRPEVRLYLADLKTEPKADPFFPFASDSFYADLQTRELLQRGFDLNLLKQCDDVVLLRSSVTGDESIRSGNLSVSRRENPTSIALFAEDGLADGVLFFRDVEPINIPSFDRASPFHPTVTQIAGHFSRSDFQNRERWTRQLAACDTLAVMDGGEMIPMGEEESVREWIAAYCSLPKEGFTTYVPSVKEEADSDGSEDAGKKSLDPIVFRYLKTDGAFWGYLVNNAPFHCGVNLGMKFTPGAETEIFAGTREISEPDEKNDGFRWSCSLKPYDLIAFKISDPNAQVDQIEISPPKEICGSGGRLEKEIDDYIDRLLIASEGVKIPLRNPGFEEKSSVTEPVFIASSQADAADRSGKGSKPILGLDIPKINLLRNPFSQDKKESPNKMDGRTAPSPDQNGADRGMTDSERETDAFSSETGESLPGWQRFGDLRFQIALDRTHVQEGDASLKLTNSGSVGGVLSQPFAPSRSGRLFANITFGIPADLPDLPLRISLSGRSGGVPWQRQLSVGPVLRKRAREAVMAGNLTEENGVFWIRDSILFDHLPTEGVTDLSLRFDLLSEGTVWIDDIRLYKFAFDRNEQAKMVETIKEIQTELAEGRISRLLERLSTPLAGMLAEELPTDSPLMAERPKRPAFLENRPSEDSAADGERLAESENRDESNEEESSKEAKSFFRRILPW